MSYNDPTEFEQTEWLLAHGKKWESEAITYRFATSLADMNASSAPGNFSFIAMTGNDPLIGVFRTVASLWDDLISNSISELPTSTNAKANINIAKYSDVANDRASGGIPIDGDVWVSDGPNNSDINGTDSTKIGWSVYETMMHEFGHVLGLYHAGNYDDGLPLVPSTYQDSKVYTIMSYFGPGRVSTPPVGGQVQMANWSDTKYYYFPQTPMMNDILAIQKLYGADLTTRAEAGTIYGFNSNIQGDTRHIYDFGSNPGQNNKPILCIYDAGGVGDRIDLSGWGTRSALSLIAGTFSNANDMTMNISIAYNTAIEDGVTGSKDDLIVGNLSDNALYGNAGDDVLYGGGGSDTLVGGRGNDNLIGAFGGVSSDFIAAGYITSDLAAMWNLHAMAGSPADVDTADYSSWRIGNAGMTSGITVNMGLATFQVTNDGFGTADNLIGIERIVGTANADTFVGGAVDIEVFGEGGADTFTAGSGAEHFDGGLGVDTVKYSASKTGVTVHFDGTVGTGGDATGDTLNLIEKVVGSAEFDTIYMSAKNNYAWGGNKDDVFYGGNYMGGTFYNEIYGESGNDTFYYRGGQAYFVGGGGAERNRLDLSLTGLNPSDQGFFFNLKDDPYGRYVEKIGQTDQKITLLDVQEFIGSGGQDSFVFVGVGRGEKYSGGDGIDTLDLSGTMFRAGAATGIAINVPSGTVRSNAGTDIASVNSLEKFVGTKFQDYFEGGNSESWFNGGGSTDQLWSGAGADHFDGGYDPNYLGMDIVSYERSTQGVRVDLANTGPQSGGFAEGDTLVNVQTVIGSNSNDVISNSSSTKAKGTIYGLGGNDELHLFAQGTIADGGGDNDKLYAHNAFQTLTGGSGKDEFHFLVPSRLSTVTDYEAGEDIYISDGHTRSGMTINPESSYNVDGALTLRWSDGTIYKFVGQTAHINDDLFFV